MSSRTQILFLCQTLPFPPDNGVNVRSLNIMKELASEFDVTALCFFRRGNRPTRDAVRRGVAGLQEFCDVEAFAIPQEFSRARLLSDHLRSVLSRRVYTWYAYSSVEYERALKRLLGSRDFSLAHVDSLDLSAYLPQLSHLPTAVTHHNSESDLLERRAAVANGSHMGAYLRFQARRMAAEERAWCGRVDLNVAVSEADREALADRAAGGRFVVIPNGVDTDLYTPLGEPRSGVVFLGGYDWFPNRDGMEFFCERILPAFRARCPEVPITWVGAIPTEVADRYRRKHGIISPGFVEDLRPFVGRAACYIVPLRVGGGTRLKVVEGWAMGAPTVSTTVGCEGLDARDGENILVRDDPEEFARAMESVVRDSEQRKRLAEAARITAVSSYDWKALGRKLVDHYRMLIDRQEVEPGER